MVRISVLTAVALLGFAWVSFTQAQQYPSIPIGHSSYLMMNETTIWIEDSTWTTLSVNGKPVRLYLDQTNPTFYALLYNTLKDHMISNTSASYIWVEDAVHPIHGSYVKIRQVLIH